MYTVILRLITNVASEPLNIIEQLAGVQLSNLFHCFISCLIDVICILAPAIATLHKPKDFRLVSPNRSVTSMRLT